MMVNYQDPVTIAQEFTALVKLWHVVNGIFIWEFFTTLDYEWGVIRGYRPYRWSIWVYSLARVTTLLAVILNMIGFDTTTPINCQLWVTFELIFAYLAYPTTSILILLRIFAVWNRAKVVIVIAMAVWVTDVSILINGIVQMRSTWSPEANTCVLLNLESTKLTVVCSLVSDMVLLLIMLLGLFRMRLEAGPTLGLGNILWKQGLIWILLATISEVPPAVFMILNLNVPLNLIFQTPCMISVTITTTRMYRSLANFGSRDVSSSQGSPGTGPAVSEMRVRSGPIPFSRMEMTARTECGQLPTLQMSRSDSHISTDQQGGYKAHEVSLNGDVESGPEK